MKICVIMSTYNGKTYLKEQLDSIYSQDIDDEIQIYVRDDCSTDNTVELIEHYAKEKNVNIIVNSAKNVGASQSFMEALRSCPKADYYFLSDQDDTWQPHKLKIALSQMESYKDTPVLWYSNYDVVDSHLRILEKRGIKENINSSLKVLFYNNVPGCVMGFNHQLMENIRKMKIDNFRMHDILIFNVALITGKVIFSNDSLINYRQHGNNVIGQYHKKIGKDWFNKKMKDIRSNDTYNYEGYAREILKNYSTSLSKYEYKNYLLISNYRKSIFKKFFLLSKKYTKNGFNRTSISIRCRILLGKM